MRLIGLAVSFRSLDVIETGNVGIYRSVYPDDGMSNDAANRREHKTSGCPHPDRCSAIHGPGALRHADYLVPYNSSSAAGEPND